MDVTKFLRSLQTKTILFYRQVLNLLIEPEEHEEDESIEKCSNNTKYSFKLPGSGEGMIHFTTDHISLITRRPCNDGEEQK